MDRLDDELGQLYGQALLAIAKVDGEIGPEEGAKLRELVAARTNVEVDFEAGFFHKHLSSDELRPGRVGGHRTARIAIPGASDDQPASSCARARPGRGRAQR